MKQKLKKLLKIWFIWITVNFLSMGITDSVLCYACKHAGIDNPDELDEREDGYYWSLGIVEAFYNVKKIIKVFKMK